MKNDFLKLIEDTFDSLEKSQEQRTWKVANRVNPNFILDDLLNPHDHPELLKNPDFNFEDGQLAGIKAARISLRYACNQFFESLAEPKFPMGWNIADVKLAEVSSAIQTIASNAKQRPIIVFDLDGTLFDVGHRTIGILKEWLRDDELKNLDAGFLERIRQLAIHNVGYSLADAFENLGLNLRDPVVDRIFSAAERAWRRRFFDGKCMVDFDMPLHGAADFVKKWQESCKIVYLSGRADKNTREGTTNQLKKHGFPLENCDILLKPDIHQEDHEYKKQVFIDLNKENHIVATFENEFINLAQMVEANAGKECCYVIVDSPHSGRPVHRLDTPVLRIKDFKIDL